MFRLGIFVLFCTVLLFVVPLSLAQDEEVTILITEVYPNPPGEELEREWIELMNVGTAVIDLSNFKVGDEESPGEKEGMLRFPKGAVLQPEQVIVIAQTAVGFRTLFGFNPDYEIQDSDAAVPDMRRFVLWSSGDVALANDGDEVILMNGRNQIIDSINYGDQTTYFSPSIQLPFEGQSIARLPANCDSDSAGDWQTEETPTPGQVHLDSSCQIVAPEIIEETYPPIGTIQGSDSVSPFVNEVVTVRGVVTGIYEDRNANGITFYTVFIQDEVGAEDGDATTSDGLALFVGQKRPSFKIGDLIKVTGQVTEFFGFTELDDDHLQIEVIGEDAPLPDPIPLNMAEGGGEEADYFEALEGMRVTMAETAVVVGPTFSGCGFAVVAQDAGIKRILRQKIEDNVGEILPILHESDVDCGDFPHVKQGDLVDGLVGPLIYHFDQFKVVQQDVDDLEVTAVPMPTIPHPPTLTANQFSVATFNMENYFDGLDDTGHSAEPKFDAEALDVKQAKITYAITYTLACPTIIAVQEVEKAALLQTIANLAANACNFTYDVTHLESVDSRGIDVAFLSNPQRITILDAQLKQTCTTIDTGIEDETMDCPASQSPLFSRPPLRVDLLLDGQEMILFNNHFKSKRGGEVATAPRRLAQANYIANLVDEILAEDASAKVIVIGDLNDYELSPPLLKLLENGRLTNTLTQIPQPERYSFNFGGVSQLLDAILVSRSLNDTIQSIHIFHTNANFPDSLATDISAENIQFRATDHDLPLVVFGLVDAEKTEEVLVLETAVSVPTPTSQIVINEHRDDANGIPSIIFVGMISLCLITCVIVWKKYVKNP